MDIRGRRERDLLFGGKFPVGFLQSTLHTQHCMYIDGIVHKSSSVIQTREKKTLVEISESDIVGRQPSPSAN